MAARVAFLVVAHDRVPQLLELLEDLRATGSAVFLHLDRDARTTAAELERLNSLAHLVPRISVSWGAYSVVAATLLLLEAAMRSSDATHFALLSNHCIPIRPFRELRDFLTASNLEHVSITPVDSPDHLPKLRRFDHYRINSKYLPSQLRRILNFAMRPIPRRWSLSRFSPPFTGSTWWTLSRNFVDWLMAFRAANPGFDRCFHMTHAPDEGYFQIAMTLSPFAHRVGEALTYADWSDRTAHHPRDLTRADWPAMQATPALFFARKYDRSSDPEFTADLRKIWLS